MTTYSFSIADKAERRIKTTKGGQCEALQLKGRPTSHQSFSASMAMLIMHQPGRMKFQHNFTTGDDLAHFRRRHVTLWPWPLTAWPWTYVADQVSRDKSLYRMWAKSNSPRLSDWSFSKCSRMFSSLVQMREGWTVNDMSPSWFEAQHIIQSLTYFSRADCEIRHIFPAQISEGREARMSPCFSEMGTEPKFWDDVHLSSTLPKFV